MKSQPIPDTSPDTYSRRPKGFVVSPQIFTVDRINYGDNNNSNNNNSNNNKKQVNKQIKNAARETLPL